MISGYREGRWLEAIGHKEQGELIEYAYSCEKGKIEYKFYKRRAGIVRETEYFDIASYRGAGGPYVVSVEPGMAESLLKEYMEDFSKYCGRNNIIAEFAKLDPWDEYSILVREILGAEYYGNFYCNDLTRDFYNEDYNRNARRGIRKALEAGVKAEFDFEGKTIPDFMKLYSNTEEKHKTSDYYRFSIKEIEAFFNIYKDEVFLINGVLKNQIITSVLVIMGQEIAHYLFLGSSCEPQHAKLQANCLLTYETAKYCQQRGRKLFDMGGGIPGGGVERFKRNFIGEDGVWEYYAIKRIHNKEIYDLLVNRKEEIKNDKFFPLYRG